MGEAVRESYAGGQIGLSLAGGVATLMLDREAQRNALTLAMWEALPALARRLAEARDVRVVLVRGAGERSFSGGADIAEFPQVFATPEAARAYNAAVRAGQEAIRRLPVPTLAVIFGACVGGGCGLALHCDLRFAAEDARLGIPPARLGAAYSFADTKVLTDLVGPARAKDILFTGRLLPAAEAVAIGLVDRVVPAARLAAEAEGWAAEVASLSSVSIGIAKATIEAIRDGAAAPDAALSERFGAAWGSEDFREGTRAFLEKRRPVFGGVREDGA